MQIHGTQKTHDYPLLRLVWVRQRKGIKDLLWAIRIVSQPYGDKKYEWLDLGKRPSGFFRYKGKNRK